MRVYQSSLVNADELNSTIELLQNTFIFVDIFSNNCSKVTSVYDPRTQKLLGVLDFFHSWESEFGTPRDKGKHLITTQTCEDIDFSIYGFIEMVNVASSLGIGLIPGYFNSDLIKNWFCQMRSLRNGANQNPTLAQIGPAINSNLITGSILSEKGNTGGSGRKYSGVLPPTKKFKSDNM